MAKVNTTVGPIKGKMGGVTFFIQNGQQMMVASKRQVKNPKTMAQMKQRIKINNILSLYKYFKEFLKDNFEGILGNKNASCFFRSHNLMLKPVWLREQDKMWDRCVLAPYIVSHGLIPSINYVFRDNMFVTDINLGNDEINEDLPIYDLTDILTTRNEGWQKGHVLKMVLLSQEKLSDESAKLKTPVCSAISISLSNSRQKIKEIPLIEARSKGNRLQICNKDGQLAIQGLDSEKFVYAFAAVHNKGEGENVRNSLQSLCLSDTTTYDSFCSEEAMVEALKSYKAKM